MRTIRLLLLFSLIPHAALSQSSGIDIAVKWEVLDNLQNGTQNFRSALTIFNTDNSPLPDHGWALYFHSVRVPLQSSIPSFVSIEHVNGYGFRLTPADGFPTLASGDSIRISFDASSWVVRAALAPTGFYVVDAAMPSPKVVPSQTGAFTSPEQLMRHADDHTETPTATSRYVANGKVSWLSHDNINPIIPTPYSIVVESDSLLLLSPVSIFAEEELGVEAQQLTLMLAERFGLSSHTASSSDEADIVLRTGPTVSTECAVGGSYQMDVDLKQIRITGPDVAGVFYGTKSLEALVDLSFERDGRKGVQIPVAQVADCPRFSHRGLMIDVARHFHDLDRLKKTIRIMSFYKLNKLHLHLTDDEGWRLPVDALPELTDIGSKRGHDEDPLAMLPPSFGSGPDWESSPGSGSYTRSEFVELLRFAADHHVSVIPEIDLPGHARAAIVAMENRHRRLAASGDTLGALEYRLIDPLDSSSYRSIQGWKDNVVDVCLPSTYRFVETVIDALTGMYDDAGIKLEMLHVGGDEVPAGVWVGSPACARLADSGIVATDPEDLTDYFFGRFASLLFERGITVGGWDEIAEVLEPGSDVVPFAWNTVWGWGGEARPYILANAGFDVVLSNAPSLYFDLAYEKHPDEPGYSWAGFLDTRTIFEFTPLDHYKSGFFDRMGNPISPTQYDDAVRLTSEGMERILGIQGQLWGEHTSSLELFEYLLYPKMLALAERAWAPRPAWSFLSDRADFVKGLDHAWNVFANSLGQREFVRLRNMYGEINFRIPPPGAVIENGLLHANTAFPGLEIHYTTDGSEPDVSDARYDSPTAVSGTVRVGSFDSSGRGSRTETIH